MTPYEERSHLLALLTILYDAYLYVDESEEVGFQSVVTLRIDDRWFGWHVADADLPLFRHLDVRANAYDGHTTEQKYEAVRREVDEFRDGLHEFLRHTAIG